jgi:methyl-accepting chemotaxis protein
MRQAIFKLGALLMNRLNYLQKFAIVALLLLIPSFSLLYVVTTQINKDVEYSQKELTGISYNSSLRGFYEKVQIHREVSVQFFLGDSTAEDLMRNAQQEIELAVLSVDSADTQYGDALAVREQWKNIKIDWKNLKSRATTHKMEKSEELHNKLVGDALALMVDVADNSNLTLDTDIETYYLMNITNFKVLQLTEALGQSKNMLRIAAITPKLTPEQRTAFTVQAGNIQPLMADIADAVNRINTYNQPVSPIVEPSYVDLKSSTDQYIELLQSEILDDSLRVSRGIDLNILDRPIKAGLDVFDTQLPILKSLIEVRIKSLQNQVLVYIAGTVLVLIFVGYLLGGFYSSVIDTVRTLEGVATQLNEGKITEVVEVETRDELGRVGRSFNQIALSLLSRNKELEDNRIQMETTNKSIARNTDRSCARREDGVPRTDGRRPCS